MPTFSKKQIEDYLRGRGEGETTSLGRDLFPRLDEIAGLAGQGKFYDLAEIYNFPSQTEFFRTRKTQEQVRAEAEQASQDYLDRAAADRAAGEAAGTNFGGAAGFAAANLLAPPISPDPTFGAASAGEEAGAVQYQKGSLIIPFGQSQYGTFTEADLIAQGFSKVGGVAKLTPPEADPTEIPEVPTASDLEVGDSPALPPPADPLPGYEAATTSMAGQLKSLKTEMTSYWDNQITTKNTEIEALNKKIADLQKEQLTQIEKADPKKSEFYDQQTTILQNQLDAAELASTKLTEDFNKARELTSQLEDLNNKSFADIQAIKGVTGLAAIRIPRINEKIDQWQGRSSILQAALTGVQGNINMSYSFIDKAQQDITARRNEELGYYNALLSYYSGLEGTEADKLVDAQKDKKIAIQAKIDVKQAKIDSLQGVVDYVKREMINDPTRIAGAGVNLAVDTIETINKKLNDYDYLTERREITNQQEKKGNKYISTPAKRDRLIEQGREIITITDSRGVRNSYVTPAKTISTKKITSTLDDEDISEFDYGRQILEANPDASNEELKLGLLENTELNTTEINALIAQRTQPAQPETFSQEWFKSKIEIARANDFSDAQIIDYIIENFDKDELFKTAKEAGFASFWTGKETDIERYIKSLL